ncbi:hypothetical protein BATDEDRAFT_85950 [Batrachochytrium dendrobatidis JAM81]|uniref:Biogenesis of lysosome-related organelles complex 1 subunit 7 n=2 Tax=Batrachochytrium dendrobatidis TaxID=109871 RepID=F4NTB0_BATDJ|nr:uncharacterized protein BATDEDRAFT_85950 [Batrachochytrium dendrobatidis JAM81]EGF83500.1 hypothetical protein BATDEDRAFT_85950 [Batrachochytrium dendrobatidis JAM81]KAJ8327077.1 hypothetical protein O5D80_004501 [Batrachochytrium dendrobatidis]KAK5668011.1 hypothetical protein QVD99_005055 [Batrachochytrium dendrobatidis]OAJ37181.1 hypothetical protein BDEG_21243 [Batrachochytrium dendrobatidis JEL423]|eukprot:XP_006676118.1 hypothetical protein BATDEDRAFT_85950 [Batrachochytrium dendrobatidis JAM81]
MSANHTTTATATNITAGLVDNLVPVLQALDMGVISAVQSQGELHAEMERLAAELQLVSSGLKPPPETDLAAERLIAIRKRMMTLQKKLRTLEDVVYKISSTVEKRAAATQSTQL